jgi:hypothetical protein
MFEFQVNVPASAEGVPPIAVSAIMAAVVAAKKRRRVGTTREICMMGPFSNGWMR